MTKTTIEDDTNQVVTYIREGDKIGIMLYLRQGGNPSARNNMGWTILHLACLEGQAEIAEILIDAGAMVNCCTTEMCTPLHLASARGHRKVVEALVAKGAYVNAQDKAGNTPLHEAAKAFHTKVVKFLLEKKADPKKVNKKKQTFINLVGQQMMPTVECGDVEVLVEWLDWGLNANTVGNFNWSLLHHSSAMGQINIASLLLERGADVNVLDSNRSTSLHASCARGHKRIVELLIGRGADLNAKDQRGNTPLHSAIEGEHPEVINLLLESGCDTTIPNKEGQIFTHLVNEFLIDAVEKSRVAHVISLLKGRADPDTKDAFGYPILCSSVFKGDLLIVDALLEAGANPNICSDDTQKTPLHYAAALGNLFILKALLDKGASVAMKDKRDSTPLHEAAREGDKDIITVLVGRGSSLGAQDKDGNTPLHIAARWGQSDIVEMFLEKGAFEEIKNKNGMIYSDLALMRAVRTEDATQVMAGLAWGGNPNIQDSKGWTLLHHAVYKSAQEVCFVLLESEPDVNIPDKHGRTPLLLAAYRGDREIVEMLIDAGADINAKDNDNRTPLHWASDEGSVETVELLLSKGASRNIRNKKGLLYTDLLLKHLYFAVRHKDENKVESLLRAGADQSAELKGTEITPREEAKRRKHYSILQKMVSLAPPKPIPKSTKDIIALEDVRKLFEDCEEDESIHESSGESDKEEFDPDEDAYWRMHNAPIVLNAKDMFEEEEKSFWNHWEEKPKVIPAKEFFKEEGSWWEKVSSSDEESSIVENSNEVTSTFEDMKKKWEVVIPAKEFFREDECWWRDAVEDLDNPKKISAKEFFKDKAAWWEENSSDEEGKEEIDRMKTDLFTKDNKIISAKQFFKEDVPWWTDNNSSEEEQEKEKEEEEEEEEDEEEEEEEEEESENDNKDFPSNKIYRGEEKSEEESLYEDVDESITEDWDTANDSIMSDTSTLYSASEGNKILAANFLEEKPWWYNDDEDQTNNSLSDEEELSEDKSDRTETTEIADEGSFIDNRNMIGRTRILSLTESEASTNIILDGIDSNSIENLLDLDIDEEPHDTYIANVVNNDENKFHKVEYHEFKSTEIKEASYVHNEIKDNSYSDNDSVFTNKENIKDSDVDSSISKINFVSSATENVDANINKHLNQISDQLKQPNESIHFNTTNDITSCKTVKDDNFNTSNEGDLKNEKDSYKIINQLSEESKELDAKVSKHKNDKENVLENKDLSSIISNHECSNINQQNLVSPCETTEQELEIHGSISPKDNIFKIVTKLFEDSTTLNEVRKENISEDQLNCNILQESNTNESNITMDSNYKNIIKIDSNIVTNENNVCTKSDNSSKFEFANKTSDEENLNDLGNINVGEERNSNFCKDKNSSVPAENENQGNANINVQYLNSSKSSLNKLPYSFPNSKVENKSSKISLDGQCQTDSDKIIDVPHSRTDKENSDLSLKLISVSNFNNKNVDRNEMREICTNTMNAKLFTSDKPVINKMDDCLARVDASLAWINARMERDSINKGNNVKSKSLECIPEQTPTRKLSRLRPISHENINGQYFKGGQENKNNQENFNILRIKVRVTDQLTNNTVEKYIERPNSTPAVLIKGNSSDTLYDIKNESNSLNEDRRNKIHYNSLKELETVNSQPKLEISTSGYDEIYDTNEKEYSLLRSFTEARKANMHTNETNMSQIHYPLVVRRHSSEEMRTNASHSNLTISQCNKKACNNKAPDKSLCDNEMQTNQKIFPLKIRRHSSHEIYVYNSSPIRNENYSTKGEKISLIFNFEKLNKKESPQSSIENNLAVAITENKNIISCNNLTENIFKSNEVSSLPANLSNSKNKKRKHIPKNNACNKLDLPLIPQKNSIASDDSKNKYATKVPVHSSSKEPTVLLKDIASSNTNDSNISPTLDKQNWAWSTFHSKSINEYDNLLNSTSNNCMSHSSFKKCKSTGCFEILNDSHSSKEIDSKLKPENCDIKNLIKDNGNDSLNSSFSTNNRVAESNLRIKPPLPPRRIKDNRHAAILSDNFNSTKNSLEKIDFNEKCLSYKLGEKQNIDLEDAVDSNMNPKESMENSLDVNSHHVLDNYIPEQTPKPPPRKKMKEEVRRSSSCSLC